jgi:hypothetical protein
MFFCLDAKEPKNQDKPEASGRFVWPAPPLCVTCFVIASLLLFEIKIILPH